MTALCGGGPSGPKSGVGGVLTIGAAAVEVFISSVLVLPELAPVLAPIIAGLVDIELAAYCSTDPPSDPGLTAGDVADAISIPPSLTTFSAQQKILRWFEARYWYQICNCTGTTTPAPSTPSNPGTITSNPGLPVPVESPCWSATVPYSVGSRPSSPTFEVADFTALGLPASLTSTSVLVETGGTTRSILATPIVAGSGKFRMTTTLDQPVVDGLGEVFVRFAGINSVGGFGDTLDDLYTASGHASSGTLYADTLSGSSLVNWGVWVENHDNTPHTGSVTLSYYCGTNPIPTPCCAPDPLLEGELQQILQYVQAIYAGLPIPPNSFAEGTIHSGLNGSGSVTFSGVPIAVKIQLTTVPAWVGFDVGDPNFYFDVGFVSFGTSEGNYASDRVVYVDQVVTVPVLAGSLGYSLKQGVVASVTELLPGP